MSLIYDLLAFLGCDPKPTISNEDLMRLTDEALNQLPLPQGEGLATLNL